MDSTEDTILYILCPVGTEYRVQSITTFVQYYFNSPLHCKLLTPL